MNKIILVDDEELVRTGLCRALARLPGVAVTSVSNGEDALREIRSGEYVLCFLDVRLPDMDGLQVLEQIRRSSPRTRIAAMTASYLEDETRDLLIRKADFFLSKPFDLSEIRSVLERAVAGL